MNKALLSARLSVLLAAGLLATSIQFSFAQTTAPARPSATAAAGVKEPAE